MRVLISGGGIAGLTLAFWLEQKGHHPVIVERAPGLRTEGYMIDFFGSGYDVAERMGVLPDLERIHYPIPRLSFVDPDGRTRYELDYARLRALFDGRHFNFMRGDLERVLHASIEGRVEMRFGTTIEAFEQDEQHVLVRLSDCSWEHGTLVRVGEPRPPVPARRHDANVIVAAGRVGVQAKARRGERVLAPSHWRGKIHVMP